MKDFSKYKKIKIKLTIVRQIKSFLILLVLIINFKNMQAQLSKHVELQELGLSFNIPNGWSGQVEAEYIVLGHTTIPGLMILSSNTNKDVQSLKAEALKGLLDEGVDLKPSGDFMLKGENRVEGMYQGTFNDQKVKGYAIGLINVLGKGMNILILTETNKFSEQHKKEANTLASSVVFYKADDTESTIYWKQKLVGTQLYQGLTRGDGSDITKIDLCSNGSFYYYSNSHIAFDQSYGYGSANSNANNTGIYKIYTVGANSVLEVTFNNGEIYEYDLSVNEQEHTFLDTTRYFVVASRKCE